MMSSPNVQTVEILLVEDNPGDVRLTLEAFKDITIANRLHVVPNGEEAIKFLRHQHGYADSPRPHMILLDLNLPLMNGIEVLREIKKDNELRSIPVVVLTTSRNEEDILKAYNLNANCYITKPVDINQFMQVVRTIDNFWFSIAALPGRTLT